MNRFFVDKAVINNGITQITGEDAHHITKVLRLVEGDTIDLCDGEGYDYDALILSLDKKDVRLKIIDRHVSLSEPEVRVTLYQGLPKGTKMELVIQKCVELGIYDIVPVVTTRTVVKLNDSKDGEKKAGRWRKISEEAAKQSGRGIIPYIHNPEEFHSAIENATATLKLLLWEKERQQSLRDVMHFAGKGHESIALMVGPEGGLDTEEAAWAAQNGWRQVSIGPRILRAETAGLAVLSVIMYQMEEMEWKKHP